MEEYDTIPWYAIKGMRNLHAHVYENQRAFDERRIQQMTDKEMILHAYGEIEDCR